MFPHKKFNLSFCEREYLILYKGDLWLSTENYASTRYDTHLSWRHRLHQCLRYFRNIHIFNDVSNIEENAVVNENPRFVEAPNSDDTPLIQRFHRQYLALTENQWRGSTHYRIARYKPKCSLNKFLARVGIHPSVHHVGRRSASIHPYPSTHPPCI